METRDAGVQSQADARPELWLMEGLIDFYRFSNPENPLRSDNPGYEASKTAPSDPTIDIRHRRSKAPR